MTTVGPEDFALYGFETQTFDTMKVISNHSTGGGFWFNTIIRGIAEVEVNELSKSIWFGDIRVQLLSFYKDIFQWCFDTFGPEWEKWHIKMIAGPYAHLPDNPNDCWTRRDPTTGGYIRIRKAHTEIFFVNKSDAALFKLRWIK